MDSSTPPIEHQAPPAEPKPTQGKMTQQMILTLCVITVCLIVIIPAAFLFLNRSQRPPRLPVNNGIQKGVINPPANQLTQTISSPVLLPTTIPSPVALTAIPIFNQVKTKDAKNYQDAVSKGAQFLPTADGKSFFLFWKPSNWSSAHPSKLIVSLHGHDGYATQDFAAWYPILTDKNQFALASLQWWFGLGEEIKDYYTPQQLQQNIDSFLLATGFTTADTIVFEGFSRGSANSYGVAALENTTNKYFDYVISNSGGFASDYPINVDITNGKYGTSPYSGLKWILFCGVKDTNPDRDGCSGMTTTKTTIEKYGANVILFIQDPNGGHGAFMVNTANAKEALNLILGM